MQPNWRGWLVVNDDDTATRRFGGDSGVGFAPSWSFLTVECIPFTVESHAHAALARSMFRATSRVVTVEQAWEIEDRK